ncbi:MAG: UPF0182 family protein [Candidatus Limnocylindria bacterium]
MTAPQLTELPTRVFDGDGAGPGAFARIPSLATLLERTLVLAYVAAAVFLVDRLFGLLMDYWLLESLGFAAVFWMNLWARLALFACGFVIFAGAIAAPTLFGQQAEGIRRRRFLQVGALAGIAGGYLLSRHFHEYLLLVYGTSFGAEDPVFGLDVGFYVFDLPALRTTATVVLLAGCALLASSIAHGLLRHRSRGRESFAPALAAPTSLVGLAIVALAGAAEIWLTRYGLLTRPNGADERRAGIFVGPHYLDVDGFFSTKNLLAVGALALLVGAGALLYRLARLGKVGGSFRLRPLLAVAASPAAVYLAFWGLVELRDQTRVTPNEPVIQLPYIQSHIDATRAAWTMDRIEVLPFVPKAADAPRPSVESLLSHPTLENAPLWPGYVSSFERVIDPDYVERIAAGGGESRIYGPTLDIFRQQEKLRPYYDFMDVDTTRYTVDGEPVMVAGAVRELPLVEPQPWLAWWGQRFVVFTHGHGLVAAPMSRITPAGEPEYLARALPHSSTATELELVDPDVYYGEGSGTMAFTNLSDIAEHDYPTEQGRAETRFPEDVAAGVRLDSLLKRVVFGFKSGSFLDVVFSDLIGDSSRVHYFRTPLERVEKVAPFLYLDSDPFAVAADGRIVWMVNGMTTSDRYPYSAAEELGDKADRRTPTVRPTRIVNYARDSVKATVDANTGVVTLYRIADEPVAETWAAIYPSLFEPADAMPDQIRDQLQYPVQLMHTIFDDLYIYFHQTDPLTFFSWEDVFDDADEVKGDLLDEGTSISFSVEPYYWIAETGGDLPASSNRYQFSLSTVFTPEGARNLRAIATAYMDGEDYGKLSILQVPKGLFYPGPEQADAAIDQDAFISQQISLWNRLGLDVIRGHTTPLVVDGEVVYVEPLFIKSAQNPVPQLKRVLAVFRGSAAMGTTLEEALRAAVEGEEDQQAVAQAP